MNPLQSSPSPVNVAGRAMGLAETAGVVTGAVRRSEKGRWECPIVWQAWRAGETDERYEPVRLKDRMAE